MLNNKITRIKQRHNLVTKYRRNLQLAQINIKKSYLAIKTLHFLRHINLKIAPKNNLPQNKIPILINQQKHSL
jgi:hypothetical protein